MHTLGVLAARAVAGGCFVVLFSLVSEMLKPKEFAGLFSAAPAVALASLAITVIDKGTSVAASNLTGMLAGGAGMVAYCVCGVFLVGRLGAKLGSLAAAPAWFLVALGGYFVFLA